MRGRGAEASVSYGVKSCAGLMEICALGPEVMGEKVRCKEVFEVLRAVAVDAKVGDEGDLVLNYCGYGEQVEVLRLGVMWSYLRVFIRVRAAQF